MFATILKLQVYKDEARDSNGRWTKTSGNLGSNAGGAHTSPTGEKHYVKFPRHEGQIHAEVAADKIHELLGGGTINHEAINVNGKIGSVTKWRDDLKQLGLNGLKTLDDKQKSQAANLFIGSALTKNWDLFGMTGDNICKDKEGNLKIVDTGGSFNYRAQGEPKTFDGNANTEIDNFLNPEKTSGRAFGPLMKENKQLFVNAASKLKDITRNDFVKATHGMKDQKQVVDTLMQRRESIMTRFGVK